MKGVTLGAALSLVPLLCADTVTLNSNVSYNGTLGSLSAQELVLHAKFPKDSKDLKFPFSDVARVEFNSNRINQGAPPDALGAHQGGGGGAQQANQADKDAIIFKGGQSKKCRITAIDETTVKCGSDSTDRDEIWRIYFYSH